jgi:hypothetical protein
MREILNRIKELVRLTMTAVRKKIVKKEKKLLFELMGFDFMVDATGKVFLIEGKHSTDKH